MGLRSTLRGVGYMGLVGAFASIGVLTGIRRSCKELDAFRQGAESLIKQTEKDAPESAKVIELLLLTLEVGHVLGHYARARDDDEALEDVMAEFRSIMARAPSEGPEE